MTCDSAGYDLSWLCIFFVIIFTPIVWEGIWRSLSYNPLRGLRQWSSESDVHKWRDAIKKAYMRRDVALLCNLRLGVTASCKLDEHQRQEIRDKITHYIKDLLEISADIREEF